VNNLSELSVTTVSASCPTSELHRSVTLLAITLSSNLLSIWTHTARSSVDSHRKQPRSTRPQACQHQIAT